MNIKTFTILLTIAILNSCSSQKNLKKNSETKQIVFGNGGGFTGIESKYTLKNNGEFFKTNPLKNEELSLKSISKRSCNTIFDNADALQLHDIDFNHPGNIYYFIEVANSTYTNRIVWGDINHKVPDNIKAFYDTLIEIETP